MIKSLMTAAVLTAATFFAVPQAQALECSNGDGYRLCFSFQGSNGRYNRWNVTLQNAHTTEVMDITCYGKELSTWESNGGLSQAEAEWVAESFCAV